MQKKNVLTMALSVSLVGVIAVGGTLAYLTANTNKLTNKFTFTTNGITLQLSESAEKPVAEDPETEEPGNGFYGYTIKNFEADEAGGHVMTITADSDASGIEYENIVPGAVISKKPVLTVPANTVDCYVYAIVDGVTDTATDNYYADFNTSDWEEVTVDGGTYGNIPVGATVLRYKQVVENKDSNQPLNALFTKITVKSDLEKDELEGVFGEEGIRIIGYSIQADTFAEATAADPEALTYFNSLAW